MNSQKFVDTCYNFITIASTVESHSAEILNDDPINWPFKDRNLIENIANSEDEFIEMCECSLRIAEMINHFGGINMFLHMIRMTGTKSAKNTL